MRIGIAIILSLAAFFLISTSYFTVDRSEFVYLTQFGRHVATLDGEKEDEAGFHLRWPWPIQSVQRFDRRLQFFDLPGVELLTHDAKGKTIDKTLTMSVYVCWRIAGRDGVDLFVRRVGSPERARDLLGQKIGSLLGATVGQMEMDQMISTDPGKVESNMSRLRQRLLKSWRTEGKEDEENRTKDDADNSGIEIVDIRLQRFNHPSQVREAIFDRIRSERNKKVADYRSEGVKAAEDIKSAAERKSRELLAEARAEEKKLKGQAEVEGDRIRNRAHGKDPQFYAFLKKLEEYQRILGDNKTVLLLSGHRELFDVLFQPPRPADFNAGVPTAVGTKPGKDREKTPKQ